VVETLRNIFATHFLFAFLAFTLLFKIHTLVWQNILKGNSDHRSPKLTLRRAHILTCSFLHILWVGKVEEFVWKIQLRRFKCHKCEIGHNINGSPCFGVVVIKNGLLGWFEAFWARINVLVYLHLTRTKRSERWHTGSRHVTDLKLFICCKSRIWAPLSKILQDTSNFTS